MAETEQNEAQGSREPNQGADHSVGRLLLTYIKGHLRVRRVKDRDGEFL